jgi:protein-S-isoprenylcysteine O-methyltransferase Ste14
MPIEHTFRWVLLMVALPFLIAIHANFFRLKLSRATFYHPNEPLLLAAGVRLCVVPCIIGMLIYMRAPQHLQWASMPLPVTVRWAGVPILLAAEGLFCWALFSLGQSFSVSLAIFEQHALITSGPYRFMRHPMYAAIMGISAALFLVTANWFLGGSLGLAALLVTVFRTPLEERTLVDRFGERYARYAEQTARYRPRSIRRPLTPGQEST